MIINVGKLFLNVEYDGNLITNKKPIVFFHGFSGCSKDWYFVNSKLPVEYTPVFIDLLGHGKSSSPASSQEYSEEKQVEQIKFIFEKLSLVKPILVGYSMGGRLAVSFAIKYPQKLEALILESTSFGLKTNDEKESRIKRDTELANRIIELPLEHFFDYWYSIPLFHSLNMLTHEKLLNLKKQRVRDNSKIGLKNSLLGFSTGKMNYHLDELIKKDIKTLLITGELDQKFSIINKDAHNKLRNSELNIVKKSGHIVHLEKTEEFLKLLNSFLLNM